MKQIIIILITFLFAATYAQAYEFTVTWPDENLVQDRDDAALYLNYQEEIDDPENSGEMIPNPESKVQRIKREVRKHLRDVIIGGAVKRTHAAKQQVISEVEVRTEGITVN